MGDLEDKESILEDMAARKFFYNEKNISQNKARLDFICHILESQMNWTNAELWEVAEMYGLEIEI